MTKRDMLLADVAWPVGLAARMIVASAYPDGIPRQPNAYRATNQLPGKWAGAHTLPAPADKSGDGREFIDIVIARRSGGLTDGPLRTTELGALLSAAATPLPLYLLPHPGLEPVMFPLVFALDGVPPGAYRYAPESAALLPVRSIQREVVRDALLLQKDHGASAAIVFLVVPMARWLHHFGDRGYRGAALQVGYLTDRLYLAAEELGLTYTASGGFTPTRTDELLGLDGYHHTTMFSFVVGGQRKHTPVGISDDR
jgi:SagB-type dehydrogenase family enzyme